MNLWSELRQRKVVQTAILYAAVAWALTEVFGFLIEAFPFLPEWTNTIVALLFVLGFPVAMFLAWMFDVGRDGTIRATPGSVRGGFAIGASMLLLVAGTAGLFALIYPDGPPSGAGESNAAADVPPNSVAVMPFTITGADAHLAESLADELIALLTRIDALNVAARNSAFRFGERREALGDIRTSLNVGAIVDGSVRRTDDGYRVAVQVIDTATGYQRWAETYQPADADIYAVTIDIAEAVVATLGADASAIAASGDIDPEARRLYHLGDQKYRDSTNEAGLREALRLYEAAAALDSDFPLPHVGIAQTWVGLADRGLYPVDDGYARARAAGKEAIAIDPDCAEAHLVLGWIALYHDWNWSAAESRLREALTLKPGDTTIIGANAALEQMRGRHERAVALARAVTRRDPLRAATYANLAFFAWTAGSVETAVEAASRAIEIEPAYPGAHVTLAQVRLDAGEIDAAEQAVEGESHPLLKRFGRALIEHAKGNGAAELAAIEALIDDYGDAGAYQIAELYAHRGDADRAFEWLERAYELRDPGLVQLAVDPMMANLHGDPRFVSLIDRLGL
jgi:TolB-like protein